MSAWGCTVLDIPSAVHAPCSCTPASSPWACFPKVPVTFQARKAFFVFLVFALKIEVSMILKICNTVQLLVNKAKLTGLWAKNCAAITGFNFKISFGAVRNGLRAFPNPWGRDCPLSSSPFSGRNQDWNHESDVDRTLSIHFTNEFSIILSLPLGKSRKRAQDEHGRFRGTAEVIWRLVFTHLRKLSGI